MMISSMSLYRVKVVKLMNTIYAGLASTNVYESTILRGCGLLGFVDRSSLPLPISETCEGHIHESSIQ